MTMMRVYTYDNAGVAFIPESGWNTPSGPRIGWADRLPTTGYWKVGDTLTIGAEQIICKTEGSPGQWELLGGSPVIGTAAIRHGPFKLKSLTGIVVSAQYISPGQSRINIAPNFGTNGDYVVVGAVIVGEGSGDGTIEFAKGQSYISVQTLSIAGSLADLSYDMLIVKSALNPINLLPT